jgi:hypothetical protein
LIQDNKLKSVEESDTTNNNTVSEIGNVSRSAIGCTGVSTKFFGRRLRDDKEGCVKFEIFPGSLDLNNEVIAYELGKLLNFDVAEASLETYNKRCVISIYGKEALEHRVKSLKAEVGTDNFYSKFNMSWIAKHKSQKAVDKYIQMIMFDLIMRQVDRHINNIAFTRDNLYSLYDNGRSLFFDVESKNLSKEVDLRSRGSIVEDFNNCKNEHGYGWTYLEDILGYDKYKHLIRHDLTQNDFLNIVSKCYKGVDPFRIHWIVGYMYRVYLIIIRQERRLEQW